MTAIRAEYGWRDTNPTCAHKYILPVVLKQLEVLCCRRSIRILDIGCGNGYVASKLAEAGHSVIGLDASRDGIAVARSAYSKVQFEVRSVYDDDLIKIVGEPVDCVISLEVVEHLFYPERLFEQCHRLLKEGGSVIISTPYHGYAKNLAISLVNGWDRHFKVEWNGGHIKFFSRRTLARMARAAGFRDLRFYGVGRLPWLWKSMIMMFEK